ncbi:MAG TPA: hypothetical protein VMI75_11095, partial [Polyangiaceae bacterium]|nr:hypothetical protein [Polyangiaceae bacterium]
MARRAAACFLVVTMGAMTESCSVCGTRFDVQFRYQMEERDGGFAFFCSHECHRKAVSGEATGGATCSACQKRFYVELVSQVVRVRGELRHACSEDCRKQILAESDGARLGAMTLPPAPVTIASATPPPVAPIVSPPLPIGVPRTSTATATTTPTATPTTTPTAISTPRGPARMHAPQRLAIFNHKGGTGKT